jgi:hypothetical protein
MTHNFKPILLTAFITTSTIVFVNTLLGTIILSLTAAYWFLKVINQFKHNKKDDAK